MKWYALRSRALTIRRSLTSLVSRGISNFALVAISGAVVGLCLSAALLTIAQANDSSENYEHRISRMQQQQLLTLRQVEALGQENVYLRSLVARLEEAGRCL